MKSARIGGGTDTGTACHGASGRGPQPNILCGWSARSEEGKHTSQACCVFCALERPH